VTSQEPENPHPAELDIPDTEVISIAVPAPVFVDSTGRRGRLWRRLAYAFGGLVMLYGGLICVSLAGGPVRSSAVLPLPGLAPQEDDDRPPPRPSPTPAPTPSHAPTTTANRAAAPPRLESTRISAKAPTPSGSAKASVRPRRTPARPSPTTKATTKPKPVATTSRPVESTTTQPPTTPATTPPDTTPPTTPVAPVPPGNGGQGGGETATPSAEVTS
jgi:hypothetical protein